MLIATVRNPFAHRSDTLTAGPVVGKIGLTTVGAPWSWESFTDSLVRPRLAPHFAHHPQSALGNVYPPRSEPGTVGGMMLITMTLLLPSSSLEKRTKNFLIGWDWLSGVTELGFGLSSPIRSVSPMDYFPATRNGRLDRRSNSLGSVRLA